MFTVSPLCALFWGCRRSKRILCQWWSVCHWDVISSLPLPVPSVLAALFSHLAFSLLLLTGTPPLFLWR
ncbi:hypothetical protein BDZ91DRAFT_745026, partial [Kalaharituber pfeilii]